jgi:predicted Fe-S protein YdhL (DUF1289 family)
VGIDSVRTPCIGICSTGIGDDVCRGCKRYKHEVIDWNAYTFDQKAAIERRLSSLLQNIVASKIIIDDEKLLAHQLKVQPVDFPAHRNLHCQLFELIKAGASQITDTRLFGFSVRAEFQSIGLKKLYEQMDQEFYALSVGHYQRYFRLAAE